MSQLTGGVFVDPVVVDYLQRIVAATRDHRDVVLGVSMRGAMALSRAAKTWALSKRRGYATPEDVRELAVPVLAHRIILDPEAEFAGTTAEDIVEGILVAIEPPAYRAA
jgi:MoxR-like ATPase